MQCRICDGQLRLLDPKDDSVGIRRVPSKRVTRGVKRFTDLRAWQACDVFKKAVYRLCDNKPIADDFGRRKQIAEARTTNVETERRHEEPRTPNTQPRTSNPEPNAEPRTQNRTMKLNTNRERRTQKSELGVYFLTGTGNSSLRAATVTLAARRSPPRDPR